MIIKNGKIAECTEGELFGVYLERGYDDIMSFTQYKNECVRFGTRITNKKPKAKRQASITVFGVNLRKILDKRGMSQKELAIGANITEASLSRYLSGERQPTIALLIQIKHYLGVSYEDLLEK